MKPTRENILGELKNLIKSTGPGDLLLVHFGGHGILESGQAYLIPANARRAALKDTAISLEHLKQELIDAPAQARILFLDACHSGFGRDTQGMEEGFERRIYSESTGIAILASCRQGQVAYEHHKNHGAFTYFLLEGLRGKAQREGINLISFDSLKDYVTVSVKKWAIEHGKQQWPNAMTRLVGDPPLVELEAKDRTKKGRSVIRRFGFSPLSSRGKEQPQVNISALRAGIISISILLFIVLVKLGGILLTPISDSLPVKRC